MSNAAQAFLLSWSIPPWATFALCVTWAIYFRGWRRIRLTRPAKFPPWRLGCFTAGLLSLWIAIASPLDTFGNLLLTAHMAQHLVLMSIAPPLILLGAPVVPLLRGLPCWVIRDALGPFFSMGWLRAAGAFLVRPAVAWIVFNAAFLGWHVPPAYELALRSSAWHETEHACFFITSLLFWFVVLEPWPARSRRSRWTVLPFLLSADIINTGFSAFLCFCGRLIYPSYADVPRVFQISPLNDQIAAAAFMWVIGSLAFLIPAVIITIQLLSPASKYVTVSVTNIAATTPRLRPAAVRQAPATFDLLQLPLVGRFLRWRYGRPALQAITLIAALVIIIDGLFGHPMSSMNLAGVIPWNYARSLAILALLFAGNLFCMACPFTLPREIGKRLGFATRNWPRALRSKWLSVGLLVVFFCSYEVFAIWDHPSRTAWVLIAYFAGAFLVDTFFRGASFCKYVCPVGQFNFVTSLLSPLGVEVRSQSTCSSCRTHDCIAGNQQQRGCELQLFLPQKITNLDCTLCMDCVKACPADNIGIFASSPVRDLLRDPALPASSIGRLSARLDIAIVAITIIASAFASAAVMVTPVSEITARIGQLVPSVAMQRALSYLTAAIIPLTLFSALALAAFGIRRVAASTPLRESPLPLFAGAAAAGCRDVGIPPALSSADRMGVNRPSCATSCNRPERQSIFACLAFRFCARPTKYTPSLPAAHPGCRAASLVLCWMADRQPTRQRPAQRDGCLRTLGGSSGRSLRRWCLDAASADADAEYDPDVRRVFLFVLITLGAVPCLADGGQLVLHQTANGFEITIFATPAPVATGRVDLSVLVQDAASHQMISGADVDLNLQSPNGATSELQPSASQAANRLVQAVTFNLDRPGLWTITVFVRYSGQTTTCSSQFRVSPSRSRSLVVWMCLLIPPIAVVLFALHQRQKHALRRTPQDFKARASSIA